MPMILLTVPGRPLNGGTVARFKAAAMQAPLEVPANGPSLTVALVTLPLGSNVTTTVTRPVGPPGSRHFAVSYEATANALLAAFGSKCWAGPVAPFFSSALRAPLAKSSVKPAFGVAVSAPPGGSSADRPVAATCPVLVGAAARAVSAVLGSGA